MGFRMDCLSVSNYVWGEEQRKVTGKLFHAVVACEFEALAVLMFL